jgi:DNA-binding response OmpR family regulator
LEIQRYTYTERSQFGVSEFETGGIVLDPRPADKQRCHKTPISLLPYFLVTSSSAVNSAVRFRIDPSSCGLGDVVSVYTLANFLDSPPPPHPHLIHPFLDLFSTECVPMRILVAENDAALAEFLSERLQQEQFTVKVVHDGTEAQRLAVDQPYDLVILDLNLHGANGLDVLRNIRSKKPELPVLIVTGAAQVEERVRSLDAGADDFVAKPFAFAELAARIRAVLRRGNRSGRAVLNVEDLELDRLAHSVQRCGHAIDLSPKEFALLEFLMRNAGQPVSRTDIVQQVWKLNFDTMTNVVDVYINYLRRKVDTGYTHALIRTIRGFGYQIGGNGASANRQSQAASTGSLS